MLLHKEELEPELISLQYLHSALTSTQPFPYRLWESGLYNSILPTLKSLAAEWGAISSPWQVSAPGQ